MLFHLQVRDGLVWFQHGEDTREKLACRDRLGFAWHGSPLHEMKLYEGVSRAKTHLLDEDGVMMGQTRSVY